MSSGHKSTCLSQCQLHGMGSLNHRPTFKRRRVHYGPHTAPSGASGGGLARPWPDLRPSRVRDRWRGTKELRAAVAKHAPTRPRGATYRRSDPAWLPPPPLTNLHGAYWLAPSGQEGLGSAHANRTSGHRKGRDRRLAGRAGRGGRGPAGAFPSSSKGGSCKILTSSSGLAIVTMVAMAVNEALSAY